jgi:zinc protease
MQREDLYGHYRRYYQPNNAVLAIAGDFETGAMLARVRELYEGIPAGEEPPPVLRAEPQQPGERRLTIEGQGDTTYLQIAYHAPAAADPDFFPLTVLDSLLSGPNNLNMFSGGISNKTSRLYRALVETELAVSISGGMSATIDPFLHILTMILHPDHTPEEALETLEAEIRRLQDAPPPAEELKRAVKQAQALFAYGSESITNQAYWLGYSEMFASYDWFTSYLDRLGAVTPEDVQRAARQYLRPGNRVVGVYLPNPAQEQPQSDEESPD